MALLELNHLSFKLSRTTLGSWRKNPASGRGTVSLLIRRWKHVLDGEFAGTFVTLPHDIRAERAGAHVIRVRAMSMIRSVTLTTTMSFYELRKKP